MSIPPGPFHDPGAARVASGPRARVALAAVVLATVVLAPPASEAQLELPDGFTEQPVVGGLDQPVGMAFLPDGRLLVIERASGKVRMTVAGALAASDPVGVAARVVSTSLEQGLLGIAVDPAWPARPYLYLLHSAPDFVTRIARFKMTGDLSDPAGGHLAMDPASRLELLAQVPDSVGEHNGGTLRFGTDGMLYASFGEDTRECAAQDTVSLRGVVLRMRVDHLPDSPVEPPDPADLVAPGNPFAAHPDPRARLVWALGLRNPYRFQVDPADGSLFVNDVGSWIAEEVDHVTGPGINFGWPFEEGTVTRSPACGPAPLQLRAPIYGYDRESLDSLGTGASVVVGAGVFRGGSCAACRFPDDHLGDYFLADFYAGFLRRLERSGNSWSLAAPIAGQPSATDWGRGFFHAADLAFGPDGALWVCRFSVDYAPSSGQIRRVFRSSSAGVDPRSTLEISWPTPRPTPARESVSMAFRIAREARVELTVHDAAGRRVATLVPAGMRPAGEHAVTWRARGAGTDHPPGIYLARLAVGDEVRTRRVILLP